MAIMAELQFLLDLMLLAPLLALLVALELRAWRSRQRISPAKLYNKREITMHLSDEGPQVHCPEDEDISFFTSLPLPPDAQTIADGDIFHLPLAPIWTEAGMEALGTARLSVTSPLSPPLSPSTPATSEHSVPSLDDLSAETLCFCVIQRMGPRNTATAKVTGHTANAATSGSGKPPRSPAARSSPSTPPALPSPPPTPAASLRSIKHCATSTSRPSACGPSSPAPEGSSVLARAAHFEGLMASTPEASLLPSRVNSSINLSSLGSASLPPSPACSSPTSTISGMASSSSSSCDGSSSTASRGGRTFSRSSSCNSDSPSTRFSGSDAGGARTFIRSSSARSSYTGDSSGSSSGGGSSSSLGLCGGAVAAGGGASFLEFVRASQPSSKRLLGCEPAAVAVAAAALKTLTAPYTPAAARPPPVQRLAKPNMVNVAAM